MRDTTLDFINEFVSKYGEAKKWNLALKYKVLFMAIHRAIDKSMNSSLVGVLHDDVVFPLSQIKNSGVIEGKCEIKDKHWSDSMHCIYRCGNVEITFDRETEYKLGRMDSDWYCKICTIKEQ